MVLLGNEWKRLLIAAITLTLLSPLNLSAQSNLFAFRKAMTDQADQRGPFAIENSGTDLIRRLQAEGYRMTTITKEWIYLSATPREMLALKEAGKIKDFHFELSNPVTFNDSSRVMHFVNQVHAGSNGLEMPYTGKNVIVGVIDDLLDYNHPDFKDDNGNTRVLYLWDHMANADASRFPSPYGYGEEYTSADLNAGLPVISHAGCHGTTVTGAAAGNGRATGYNQGMAPDANIIFVRSNFSANNWSLTIADAVEYIFTRANTLGLPCVINISAGNYLGSHDGKDPASVKIANLVDAKKGRIVVVSAGNAGSQGDIHAHAVVDSDTSFLWMNGNPNPDGFGKWTMFHDLWGGVTNVQNINFAFGANAIGGAYPSLGRTAFRNVAVAFTPNFKDTVYDANNKAIVALDVYAGVEGTNYEMFVIYEQLDTLTPMHMSFITTGSGECDLWTWGQYSNRKDSYYFVDDVPDVATMPQIAHYIHPDTLQTIGSGWIASDHTITVGNVQNRVGYIDLNGDSQTFSTDFSPSGVLALTSSKGPTRDNRMKPDVCAAGDGSMSPGNLIFVTIPAVFYQVDSSGWFVRNGGTSMASPVVAGIAALYLEKCPNAGWQDFKEELTATCYTDANTGVVPNYGYGYGKVHALDLMLHNPRPVLAFNVVDTICVDAPAVPLTATPAGGTFSGNGVFGPAFSPVGLELNNVTITYTYTDDYGCYTESDNEQIYVDTCKTAGLDLMMPEVHKMTVYPNPSNGTIQVSGASADALFELYDVQGKRMTVKQMPGSILDLSPLSQGVYELRVKEKDRVVNIKIRRL